MLAPTSFRFVLALARQFDEASPEPLGNHREPRPGLIAENRGSGVLLKLMEPQHPGWP
jgi:hypothetical protein